MSFTVKNVVDDIRPLVSDTDNPYRWTDQQIIVRINDAIQYTFVLRPDAATSASVEPPDSLDSLYDEIPLRATFRAALGYYASAMLLQERSSDKSLRAQGKDHMQLYRALVGA